MHTANIVCAPQWPLVQMSLNSSDFVVVVWLLLLLSWASIDAITKYVLQSRPLDPLKPNLINQFFAILFFSSDIIFRMIRHSFGVGVLFFLARE